MALGIAFSLSVKYRTSIVRAFRISVTDLAICWTLDNILKPLATINLSKSPTFFVNFKKVLNSIIFLVESLLGNFYRHLAIFSGHTVLDIKELNYSGEENIFLVVGSARQSQDVFLLPHIP